jgi:hypothetical protein
MINPKTVFPGLGDQHRQFHKLQTRYIHQGTEVWEMALSLAA